MTGLGHNGGPSMEGGATWRRHCWHKARNDLVPTLPIEVVRRRVARAKELGLPYKTYASVRASTGRDVIGFLFSSNALQSFPHRAKVPNNIAAQIAKISGTDRIGFMDPALKHELFDEANPDCTWLDRLQHAPHLLASWSDARRRTLQALRRPDASSLPADGVLLVGVSELEQAWAEAARLGGYLTADQVFDLPTR